MLAVSGVRTCESSLVDNIILSSISCITNLAIGLHLVSCISNLDLLQNHCSSKITCPLAIALAIPNALCLYPHVLHQCIISWLWMRCVPQRCFTCCHWQMLYHHYLLHMRHSLLGALWAETKLTSTSGFKRAGQTHSDVDWLQCPYPRRDLIPFALSLVEDPLRQWEPNVLSMGYQCPWPSWSRRHLNKLGDAFSLAIAELFGLQLSFWITIRLGA